VSAERTPHVTLTGLVRVRRTGQGFGAAPDDEIGPAAEGGGSTGRPVAAVMAAAKFRLEDAKAYYG
jgi:hypothetical protein